MYENDFERMVEAGLKEKEESELNSETDLPSRYRLILPEFLLFVNESGCNTSNWMMAMLRENCLSCLKNGHYAVLTRETTATIVILVLVLLFHVGLFSRVTKTLHRANLLVSFVEKKSPACMILLQKQAPVQ
jgi:hypothetical protein